MKIKKLTEDYDFSDDSLNEALFKQYYPNLNFADFKESDLWHQCVINDLFANKIHPPSKSNRHSNLVNNNPKLEDEGMYNDNPGPVG